MSAPTDIFGVLLCLQQFCLLLTYRHCDIIREKKEAGYSFKFLSLDILRDIRNASVRTN